MSDDICVIAAHPDDEVLGCGASLARFAREGYRVHVLLLADGESSRSCVSGEAQPGSRISGRKEAAMRASEILGCTSVELLDLPDNRLDSLDRLDVVKLVESFVERHEPFRVLTHHAGDVNIDHRVVHDAVIASCRSQPGFCVRELLFFEVPSSTEWRPPCSMPAFEPNYFVDVSDTIERKLRAMEAYRDEMREAPHPRSRSALNALAQWRGAIVGVSAAEAFMLGRMLL